MIKYARIVWIALMFMPILMPGISHAEVIDVQIKGMDDGIKTTSQQDYKEAVLFAKREAIERAGVKIQAKSTVKNFVVDQDYIESQAEAVLLPGYQIVDMGYSAEGVYQIVLIGKIDTGEKKALPAQTNGNLNFDGYTWKVVSGQWEMRDGVLWIEENSNEAIIAFVPDQNMKNYSFEIDVEAIEDSGVSIHMRSNPIRGSSFSVEDDNLGGIAFNSYPTQSIFNIFLRRQGVSYGKGLWDRLEPTWASYQQSALFSGKRNTLKIQAQGSHFKIYVNRVLLTQFWQDFTDDGTVSIVAFGKSRYKFSNLKITP